MKHVAVILLISLLPLLIYVVLYKISCRQAIHIGATLPSFYNKNLLKAFIASVIIALISFIIFITLTLKNSKIGHYVPAKIMRDGMIQKGYIASKRG